MAIEWTEQNVARLLECETDEQLREAFRDAPLETLKRRKRLIVNSGTKRVVEVPVVREVDPSDYAAKDRKIIRLEEEIKGLRRNYKAQTRSTAELDAILAAIYETVPVLPQAVIPEPYEVLGKEIEEESAVLVLGDIHYGQVVDPESNGGISAYNTDIAKRRFEFTIDKTIELAHEKLQGYRFQKLYVFGLGDWVSGIIHDETIANNEVNIVEQILAVTNLLAEGLLRLAMTFPEVHFVGISGNHGRTQQKPYWNDRQTNNYDYLVAKTLERMLSDQPTITFNIPKSFWAIQEVENTRFLITHGDVVRGWGGIPFYGLQRLYTKMRTLQQDYGADFHHMVVGHLHNPNWFSMVRFDMIINGALVGGDPFSIGAVSAACDPVQFFFGVHPRRGITWRFPVNSAEVK